MSVTDIIDIEAMTDDELEELRQGVAVELARRSQRIAARDMVGSLPLADRTDVVSEALDAVNRDTLTAEGWADGDPWRQPQGAHDAYPRGAVVSHDGREWQSLIPANVWRPGNLADPQTGRWWRDLTPEPTDPDEPEGPSPWAAGVAYTVGDPVTHDGHTYTCRQAHTSQPGWEPPAVPALWTQEA